MEIEIIRPTLDKLHIEPVDLTIEHLNGYQVVGSLGCEGEINIWDSYIQGFLLKTDLWLVDEGSKMAILFCKEASKFIVLVSSGCHAYIPDATLLLDAAYEVVSNYNKESMECFWGITNRLVNLDNGTHSVPVF